MNVLVVVWWVFTAAEMCSLAYDWPQFPRGTRLGTDDVANILTKGECFDGLELCRTTLLQIS